MQSIKCLIIFLDPKYFFFQRLILTIAAYVRGCDAESRKLKKTLVRHCNLMGVLLIRSLSRTDNNRKKTLEEAVELGGFNLAFAM